MVVHLQYIFIFIWSNDEGMLPSNIDPLKVPKVRDSVPIFMRQEQSQTKQCMRYTNINPKIHNYAYRKN